MIHQGFKPRIFDRLKRYAGKWVKELPTVLWALLMTLRLATGLTIILIGIRLRGNATYRGSAQIFLSSAVF
jgi:hypothetical protein